MHKSLETNPEYYLHFSYFEQLSTRNPSEDNLNFLPGSDGDSIPGSSPPTMNGMIMSQSPPVTTASLFESRPSLLNRGVRVSQSHFPTQYQTPTCQTPESTTSWLAGTNNPYTPPPTSHHVRNGSSSSSYSPAGSLFHLQNIGPVIQPQTQNNYEFTQVQNHRRTSSFPSQPHSGIMTPTQVHNQSQPIPIPCENSILSNSIGTSGINPMGNYSNSNMEPNSVSTSYSNLEQLNLNGSTTIHRPESRVGSPLEKISEGGTDLVPPIWCLDCQENIVVLGTGTGRIELWDAFSGYLKVYCFKTIYYVQFNVKIEM